MKLVSFENEGSISCGVLTDKGIFDIPSAYHNAPRSIKQILIKGKECIEEISRASDSADKFINPDEVNLLAPVLNPGKLLALAGNYRKHIIEAGRKLGLAESPRTTTVPRPFIMPPSAATGHTATVPWPEYSEQVDYEVELAVVIGKTCRCVSPEYALEYVAGYTIANDISARSVTFSEGRTQRPWDEFFDWLNGKWSDGFFPLGPCLTTADEFGDPQNKQLELKVNGKIRQNANTSEMIFPAADTISFISRLMTLEPGDIIATGTPEGVAMATGDWLKPGDRIECKIEKIGTLENTIGEKPKKFYKPCSKE